MFVISIISMLIEGWFIVNYITSIYLIFSPFIILTLKPKPVSNVFEKGYFEQFFKIFAQILIVVNISAAIYAVIVLSGAKYPDDVFTGLYGKSGFGSHSLSIINMAVAAYYFYLKSFKKLIFFFVCGILGFFGLGLIIIVLTTVILSIPYLIRKIRLVLKGVLIVGFSLWAFYLFNPQNIDYILLNLRDSSIVFQNYSYKVEMNKITNYKRNFVPRYLIFLDGTQKLFFSNPKVFLLGTSPGTYNSRTAFYLNGDFLESDFIKEHFSENTTYHEKYVRSLLNRKLISKIPWNDGTRNQPFSSIISVLLEYGIIIGGGFLLLFFKKIRTIRRNAQSIEKKDYIKFLSVYLFLLFFVQNYLEYPEVILFFIVGIKLMDMDNTNGKHLENTIQP